MKRWRKYKKRCQGTCVWPKGATRLSFPAHGDLPGTAKGYEFNKGRCQWLPKRGNRYTHILHGGPCQPLNDKVPGANVMRPPIVPCPPPHHIAHRIASLTLPLSRRCS